VPCVFVPLLRSGWFVLLCGFCCFCCVLRRPGLRGRLCSLCVPLGFLLPFLPPSFLSPLRLFVTHNLQSLSHVTITSHQIYKIKWRRLIGVNIDLQPYGPSMRLAACASRDEAYSQHSVMYRRQLLLRRLQLMV
jgi:hypothetical protein